MGEPYTLDQYVDDLRRITAETDDEDELFSRIGPLASRLALQKGWVRPQYYQTDEEQGFGVHLLHEEDDHSLAVFAVSWLPGRGAPAHDHGTWAVVAGVDGPERNVRYARLDDRSEAGRAKLEVKAELEAHPGDVVFIRDGGIHAVWNDTDKVTLSLHTYGRHINHTGRSVFDPDAGTEQPFIVRVN